LFLLRVGLNTGLNLTGFVHVDVVPITMQGIGFGVFNFFARAFTIIAPQLAERRDPFPLAAINAMNIIGIIVTQWIKIKT